MVEESMVFVKVDNYKDITDTLALIKEKIVRAKEHLAHIDEIKAKEDEELKQWLQGIDEVETKLEAVHAALSASEKV